MIVQRNRLDSFRFPDGFVLIQDTREQKPLFDDPPNGLHVVTKTLLNGDYSIRGFEDKFTVERKKISDFFQYIGKNRHQTVQKLEIFRKISLLGGFTALAIEASESAILSGYHMSKVSPEAARQALVSFEVRYGLRVYYSKSRTDMRRWILDRAIKYFQIMREIT